MSAEESDDSGAPMSGALGLVRKRSTRLAVAALTIVILAVALLWRWRSRESDAAPPQRDVPYYDGKWIRFSAGFAERADIRTATCAPGTLSPIVSVTGTVVFDPELVAAIGARIAGRVKRIRKFPGDTVKAGEVIAELESAELGQAQAALVSARAHAVAAGANETREKLLAEQKVVAQRDAELAHATALAARADQLAAEQRLVALGGATGELGVLPLPSPIAGKVVELFISRGQSVEPSNTCARVADLSRVWIDLAVFERELPQIRGGDAVEIAPQTDATNVVQGRVANVGDVIDRDTRSAPVRVVVENRDGALRPGQSVLAKIHTTVSARAMPMIPLDALATIDGNPTVFVAQGDTSVEPRRITLGARDASNVLVLDGLAAGERIVVGGVFALKSEVFR